MEVGKRMGAKRGNLTEAIKEAIEIWIKADVLTKLKYLLENSTSTGQDYKNLVDSLKAHGDAALPILLDITNNEGISQRTNYLTAAIKELTEKKS
jgi:hypothetical protein